MQRDAHVGKYALVFFITLSIFVSVYMLANFLYQERINQIKSIESNINQNILESEVQYALLADASCDESGTAGSSLLVDEINNLAQRLSYMEDQRGTTDAEVISLKKYYSLLQVKDYLLLRERARQCGERPLSILYFYSNAGDCADCQKLGYVLTSMRKDYNQLHIYAFDYNLGLSVIETLKSLYKTSGELPAVIVNHKVYYGFKTRDEMEALIPELAQFVATSTTATTTGTKKGGSK